MTVEVIAHAEESFVLLGRDVLNYYRLVLDGPNLILEIALQAQTDSRVTY